MDTIGLLLADRSPALRYRALVELDGASSDDPEVASLADELASSAEVARALRSPGDNAIRQSFTLCRLAYAGLARGHHRVDATAEQIFRWQQRDGSWPDTGPGGADTNASWLAPGEHYEWHPLQTALPLRGLAAAGFATDPRAERAYEWLLDRRIDDGTWAYGKVPGRRPGAVRGYRRMAQSEGCRATTTGALACFAHHPERRTSPEARSALDVLLRRETREQMTLGFEVSRLLGVEQARGFATFYAVFDLAFVLDLASRIGVSSGDDRLARLVAFLESKRGPFGLWDHPVHPHLSRWLTLDILASLRRIESGDWTGSGYRLPFTAYPKKRKRY
jgi:hypothetical protein